MGESPTDSHFINEEFSLLNKCSSKTKTMTTAAGFFKNVQPILLSGVMKDWERSNERFPRKCSVIHDAKDSTALPQLTNDIIHSPVHYFKGDLIFLFCSAIGEMIELHNWLYWYLDDGSIEFNYFPFINSW